MVAASTKTAQKRPTAQIGIQRQAAEKNGQALLCLIVVLAEQKQSKRQRQKASRNITA